MLLLKEVLECISVFGFVLFLLVFLSCLDD